MAKAKKLSQEELDALSPEEQKAYLFAQSDVETGEGAADLKVTDEASFAAPVVKNITTMTDQFGPMDNVDPSIRPDNVPEGYVHASAYEGQLRELSMQVSEQAKEMAALRARSAGIDLNMKVVAPTIPAKVIKVGGKSYKFATAALHLPGHGRVTAEEALLDKGILEQIIAIDGQGILVEQV